MSAAALAIHRAICEGSWDECQEYDGDCITAAEAATPLIQAQTLRDAIAAFPLETITAPDNAVVWLMRRAEQIEDGA